MIGCDGDCDNCNQDGAERKRQELINNINNKAADVLKVAKSFKTPGIDNQKELIFEKGKHFDVLERAIAVHETITFAKDIEIGSFKNLLDAFYIYWKLIKNWNANINAIVEEDLKTLDGIYRERLDSLREKTNTNVDLSGISKEDLEKELARRANK
nr:MAG TPA: hypothetical protein [Crassvirales sp.]